MLDAATTDALQAAAAANSYVVEGQVVSPDKAGVGGLTVEIFDHSLDGAYSWAER